MPFLCWSLLEGQPSRVQVSNTGSVLKQWELEVSKVWAFMAQILNGEFQGLIGAGSLQKKLESGL